MNMSDSAAARHSDADFPPPEWLLPSSARGSAFAPDSRFGRPTVSGAETLPKTAGEDDALASAFAAGLAQGLADAARASAATGEQWDRLGSAIVRLDEHDALELARRLRQTVLALCESVIADAAFDADALARRCHRAVEALNGAPDTIIHLNPEDIAELPKDALAGRSVRPDIALPRGQIRAECGDGGYICGPEEWLREIRQIIGEVQACAA